LPSGIPGIGDEIDAAIQQAPHPGRHSMISFLPFYQYTTKIFFLPINLKKNVP
jgi:hypothetical protein